MNADVLSLSSPPTLSLSLHLSLSLSHTRIPKAKYVTASECRVFPAAGDLTCSGIRRLFGRRLERLVPLACVHDYRDLLRAPRGVAWDRWWGGERERKLPSGISHTHYSQSRRWQATGDRRRAASCRRSRKFS